MCFWRKTLCLSLKCWQVNNPLSNGPTTLKWPVRSYFYCYHLSIIWVFLFFPPLPLLKWTERVGQLHRNTLPAVTGNIYPPLFFFCVCVCVMWIYGLMHSQIDIHDMEMKFKLSTVMTFQPERKGHVGTITFKPKIFYQHNNILVDYDMMIRHMSNNDNIWWQVQFCARPIGVSCLAPKVQCHLSRKTRMGVLKSCIISKQGIS